MGINPPPMTEDQYRQRSLDTVVNAWAEFEAESRDFELDEYRKPCAYYVDDDLVVSITDIGRKWFFTCFHNGHPSKKHFDTRYHDKDLSEAAIGNRRLRYIQKIKRDVQGKLIQKYKPIRGVPHV